MLVKKLHVNSRLIAIILIKCIKALIWNYNAIAGKNVSTILLLSTYKSYYNSVSSR